MAAYGLSTTFKRRKYIKYDGLGESVLPKDPVSKGLKMLKDNQTTLYGLGAGVVDVIDQGNEYGVQSNVGSFAKGALSGAAMGSTLGPIGTGVGALIGGGISLMQNKKRASEQREMEQQSAIRNKRLKDNFYAAKLQANPELVQGNQNGQYFENGGPLSEHYLLHKKTYGGSVVPKSSDGVEFQGNSHDEGGIKIPEMGVEVEGNETAKDNYVFSDKLGFAKLHKPILRAKGKIESKAPTPERINAINLLNEREKRLMNLQEMFKKKMNINQQQ